MGPKHVFTYVLISIVFRFSCARIQKLEVKDDEHTNIAITTFGFYEGGIMDVKFHNFRATPFNESDVFGFSLARTYISGMKEYLDTHQEDCLIQQVESEFNEVSHPEPGGAIIYFILDFKEERLRISCSQQSATNHHSIQIYRNANSVPLFRPKIGSVSSFSGPDPVQEQLHRRSVSEAEGSANIKRSSDTSSCSNLESIQLPMTVTESSDGSKYFNANFVVYVASESDEGRYSLFFHNCPNYKEGNFVTLDFLMEIEESNNGNFLSAGEMPIPALDFMMSLLHFLSGCSWVFILRKSWNPVCKIHYILAVLFYLKSQSLMFHGIKFHYIQTKGEPILAWAILYNIAHMLKEIVLFVTIVLVGAGWTFIKQTLSEKDKKILTIVILLKVVANTAGIMIDESEKGAAEHQVWRDVFILVDLLCCGAVIFPVLWSMRHVAKAPHRYGRATMDLRKLFRYFYFMLVLYIFYTRFLFYLIEISVPFQYEWLDNMFSEMAIYLFIVLTAYMFRPALAHSYSQLTTQDDDEVVIVQAKNIDNGIKRITQIS